MSGDVVIPAFIYTEDNGMLPVTSIASGAFHSIKITGVTIEEGYESIDENAFYECSRLTKVTIPSTISYIANNAFNTNVALQEFVVDPFNTSFTTLDGVLYTFDMKTLVKFPQGWKRSTTYSIPDTVTTIVQSSLALPGYVTKIHIGKNVSNIANFAITWLKNTEAFTVDPENKWFREVNGVLYTMDMKGLVCWPSKNPNLIEIPEGVERVWSLGLSGKAEQRVLKIPASLKVGECYVTRRLETLYISNSWFANHMEDKDKLTEYGAQECSVLQASYVSTIYIKTGLSTSVSTYLAKYFTKQSSSDEAGFDKYVRNS